MANFNRTLNDTITVQDFVTAHLPQSQGQSVARSIALHAFNATLDFHDWTANDNSGWTDVTPTTEVITVASNEKSFSNAQNSWSFGHIRTALILHSPGRTWKQDFEFDDVSGNTNVLFGITSSAVPGSSSYGIYITGTGIVRLYPGSSGPIVSGVTIATGVRYTFEQTYNADQSIDMWLTHPTNGRVYLGQIDSTGAFLATGVRFQTAVNSINDAAGTLIVDDYEVTGPQLGIGGQRSIQPLNLQTGQGTNSSLGGITNQMQLFDPLGESKDTPLELAAGAFGEKLDTPADFVGFEGESFADRFGLAYERDLMDSVTIMDSVDYNGDFTRDLVENMNIFARLGHSKGLFFRADASTIVTSNTEVRKFDETPDSGEIAVSERPNSGPLKVLRYVPGSTVITPNTLDLGTVPDDVGSQGFIYDESPQGILLRGEWEVKILIQDSQAAGQIRLHVNLFVVKAGTTFVTKEHKVGPTKFTAPFVPSTTPTQFTFTWLFNEAGEIFVGADEYLYVEIITEEVAHPGINSLTRMRLNNFTNDLFSEFRFPGVTDEPTFSRFPPSEAITIADSLSHSIGLNRSPPDENITILDSVGHSIGFQRTIIENITITDSIFSAINVIYENVTIADSVDRQVDYNRGLTENVVITDSVFANSLSNRNFVENITIEDFVEFSITRPDEPPKFPNDNKRVLDQTFIRKRLK